MDCAHTAHLIEAQKSSKLRQFEMKVRPPRDASTLSAVNVDVKQNNKGLCHNGPLVHWLTGLLLFARSVRISLNSVPDRVRPWVRLSST